MPDPFDDPLHLLYRRHRDFCCRIHGCHYGDPDCPVRTLKLPQHHPCDVCDEVSDRVARAEIGLDRFVAVPDSVGELLQKLQHSDPGEPLLFSVQLHGKQWPLRLRGVGSTGGGRATILHLDPTQEATPTPTTAPTPVWPPSPEFFPWDC